MARSIAEIQASIIAAKNADAVLNGLNSTSNVSIWLLWTYVVATAQWVMENLFDAHKAEVKAIIDNQKPHSVQWYATKAKAFQFGDTLPDGSDVFEVIDATKQIVAFAAAVESNNLIRLKVAKLSGSVLAPLSGPELVAFTAYMARVKDAGVRVECTSGAPDNIRVAFDIFYDPLVLGADGKRLDGNNDTPVQSAINVFLDSLPFNGVFIKNRMVAAAEGVEGVIIAGLTYCAANYGALPYTSISFEYTPDAGYLLLDGAYFIANTIYTPHGTV